MQKKIYIDESGFTGYNYLDPLQPIFSLASNDIAPELAEEILKKSFPNYKGDEFKFSALWKSRRKEFLKLATLLQPYGEGIHTWVIDKPFAVLVKMVDFLIEPAITAAGYNFLADGFGRKYTNYIHFGLNQFGTLGCLDELILAYQVFSRNPSKTALADFVASVKSVYQKQSLELKTILGEMLLGAQNFERYSDLDTFKSTNDLQFTAMLALVADWRKKYTEDFFIVHDASSNFLRQKETWTQVTSTEIPEQLHPLGDGTFVQFPLRVVETSSVNSKDNYSVQLSDLLAGYASRHFDLKRPADEREILDGMVTAGLFASSFNSIMPGRDFPAFPPKKLDGPDAVDLMIKMMNGDK